MAENINDDAAKQAKIDKDPCGKICKDKAWIALVRERDSQGYGVGEERIGRNEVLKTMYPDYVFGRIKKTAAVEKQREGLENPFSIGGYAGAPIDTSIDNPGDTSKRAAPGNEEDAPSKKKSKSRKGISKGEQVGQARAPGATIKKFTTSRYTAFVWDRDGAWNVPRPAKFSMDYSVFDAYKLLTGDLPKEITKEVIPYDGVRRDDRWCAIVALMFPKSELNKRWMVEFDSNGMLRATRMPIGVACLVWVTKEHKDVDDKAAEKDGLHYG